MTATHIPAQDSPSRLDDSALASQTTLAADALATLRYDQNMSYAEPGKQVIVQAFGESPLDAVENHLSIEDQPPPDPATLGGSDVVVRVHASAVGWVDLLMMSGQYQHMAKPPYCPGLEYAGEIIWKGAGVDTLNIGDRVVADGFATGPRSLGPYQKHGGHARFAVAPAGAAIPLMDHIGYDQACNLLSGYETAYHCLLHRGRLKAGETVLIHGASGVTGLAAVDLAKVSGATVIATGRNAEKLAIIKERGADHTIELPRDAPPQFRDEVKALTNGRGVDVVYDSVGGAISLESLRCVSFGGRFLIVGWAATPYVAKGKGKRGAPNANQLPTNLIMMKSLDVLGCPAGISAHRDPTMRKARLQKVLDWAAAGTISPYVPRAYPIAQIREALKAKWRSEFVGGCVIHP